MRMIMATCAGLALPLLGLAVPASAAVSASTAGGGSCSAGARTLSPPGSHVYSETGNGGYTSQHTLVHLVYNAKANKFLTGNRVEPTHRATQGPTNLNPRLERHPLKPP